MNVHDNTLTKRVALTPFREHVVETLVQCCVILVCIKHVLLERVEKVLLRRVGAQMQRLTNIFEVMVLTELEWDIGVELLQG